ncbi:hypothetical protein IMZ48_09345 [Candidatus Bathyarchaeota archaeon]|nr:hypothetical protein [Candidatus Bathyarchaeota archaeon]
MRSLDDMSQAVFETGSFTGYRPLRQLGSGYLAASQTFKQPLCGNEEGWGPLSPFRYDFTPCFIDVWIASVAAFGLFAGAIAVVWLLKFRHASPVSKGWHFYTKQVCIRMRPLPPGSYAREEW